MADAITGNTELSSQKTALIDNMAQMELAANTILAPTIRNVSDRAIPGSLSIAFPRLTSFTASDRAEGVAGDATALTSANDVMLLEHKPYVAYIIDSVTELQTMVNNDIEFAKRAGTAFARRLDTEIVTELEAAGTVTTTAGAISQAIVLEMREALFDAFADMTKLTLAIGGDSESVLLAIDDFIRADHYGEKVIERGVLGRLYGVKVVVSNLIGTTTFYMYEESGIAHGFQQGITSSRESDNTFGSKAERVAFDAVFGVQAMQNSTLIIKDNNA